MQDKDITVRDANKGDAEHIAEAIMMAVGGDLVEDIGNGRGREAVKEVFAALARMEESQYSYRNSMVAVTRDGEIAGIVVAYDGRILIEARRLFFSLAKDRLGWEIRDKASDGEPEVETDPSEYYLDSLAVWPQYRGRGISSTLIEAVEEKARTAGKPVGLLCDEHNHSARRIYEHLGFREVGKRPFAGELMAHLVKDLTT